MANGVGAEHSTSAPAQVVFGWAERCLPTGSITCDPAQLTSANAAHWPDVPFDQICTSSTSCPDRVAPSFFSRKRLTSITTKVWNGAAYDSVDSWTLAHQFPDPGDGTKSALWLASIEHTGLGGGTLTLPAVTFSGIQMDNRVDGIDNAPPLVKWRLFAINSESGSTVSWSYTAKECSPTIVPVPETNTKRCFPVYWTPEGETEPERHWFHKYLVTQVVEQDRSGASDKNVVTGYTYLGAPAWHYDDSAITPVKYRTWGQWRGYQQVRTIAGEAGSTQSRADQTFYRGMDGDRATPAGGAKDVWVSDSEGSTEDHWRLQGMLREEITYNGPAGAEVGGVLNDMWRSAVTAADGSKQAMIADVGTSRERTVLAAGGYLRTQTTTTFDGYGLPTQTDDLGNTATAADDLCTRISYARNTGAWMLSYTARAETVSVKCATTPNRPAHIVSDTRSFYDGSTTLGAAPSKGDVTKTDEITAWTTAAVYQTTSRAFYDIHGRVTQAFDALDRQTTTVYTPATGGPLTQTVVTSPDPDGAGSLTAHVTTTSLDPRWGVPTQVVDPNGKRTDAAYDPLGRLIKGWLPGRDKATQTPNTEYLYTIRALGPNAVTTKRLNPVGGYITSVDLFDGLMRPRQIQAQAAGGGRTITDTLYDSRGLARAARGPVYNTSAPATTVFAVADAQIPGQTVTSYDGAERLTTAAFLQFGVEKWRTTTSYGGDRVNVDPPVGGTPTTTITDARGRTIELRQYHGAAPTGSFDATTYTHTPAGLLATVRDPAGNEWTYAYDLRGRQTTAVDPDRGTTASGYDAASQLVTTTDARGITLAYTYDALGRRTTLHDGNVTGPKRAEGVYDTIAKGQQTKSIRWLGTSALSSEVTGFDNGYRPTGTKTTVPAVAGVIEAQLAGTYTKTHTYNVDGSLNRTNLTTWGPLWEEQLRHTYNEIGQLDTTGGSGSYVSDTVYSPYGEPLQFAMGNTPGKKIWQTLVYEDGTRRLARTRLDREAVPTQDADMTYGYDSAGNLLSVKDAPPGQTADNQCYAYDHLRRLTQAWTPASGDCATAPSASGLGGAAPYWHSWTFDVTGNRLSETRHATTGDTVDTYTYPATGQPRPHGVTQVASTGPSGPETDTYSYDTAGRVLAGSGQTLTWDPEGHLAKVAQSSTVLAEFVYDGDGARVVRREPGKTTLYLGQTELSLNTSTGVVTGLRYYSHAGLTVAVRTGNAQANVSTLIPDHHGTAERAVANTTAALTVRRTLPYGGLRGPIPGSWPGQRGFVGGTNDATVALTHLGAREYDPNLGRFISVDPIMDVADPQQMHGYAYANNNPLVFIDPDGRRFVACDGGCTTNGGYGQTQATSKHKVTGAPNKVQVSRRTSVRLTNGTTISTGGGRPTTINGQYVPKGGPARSDLARAADALIPILAQSFRPRNSSDAYATYALLNAACKSKGIKCSRDYEHDLSTVRLATPEGRAMMIGGRAGVAGAVTAGIASVMRDAARGAAANTGDEAFHYTFSQFAGSIEKKGLRPGSYATPDGTLSPLQAHIDLALRPNRGLPDALIRVDLAGLRKAGYEIPNPSQVGRSFNMPGGGSEMQFPYAIPPQFLKVIPR